MEIAHHKRLQDQLNKARLHWEENDEKQWKRMEKCITQDESFLLIIVWMELRITY